MIVEKLYDFEIMGNLTWPTSEKDIKYEDFECPQSEKQPQAYFQTPTSQLVYYLNGLSQICDINYYLLKYDYAMSKSINY